MSIQEEVDSYLRLGSTLNIWLTEQPTIIIMLGSKRVFVIGRSRKILTGLYNSYREVVAETLLEDGFLIPTADTVQILNIPQGWYIKLLFFLGSPTIGCSKSVQITCTGSWQSI